MQNQKTGGGVSSLTRPHSVRMTDSLWLSGKRRATGEGLKLGAVIIELMDGYARGQVHLVKPGATGDSNAKRGAGHSVRVADALWNAAKRRASREGFTMNDVITSIVEMYSRGLLDMPKVTKTFGPGPAASVTS